MVLKIAFCVPSRLIFHQIIWRFFPEADGKVASHYVPLRPILPPCWKRLRMTFRNFASHYVPSMANSKGDLRRESTKLMGFCVPLRPIYDLFKRQFTQRDNQTCGQLCRNLGQFQSRFTQGFNHTCGLIVVHCVPSLDKQRLRPNMSQPRPNTMPVSCVILPQTMSQHVQSKYKIKDNSC